MAASLQVISATIPTRPIALSQGLLAYCSRHDLLATVSDAWEVVVYRISGQIAFTIKQKDGECEVTSVAWKGDGSVLAVGWGDGAYGLYSGENGRLVGTGTVRDATGGVAARGWRLDLREDRADDGDVDESGPVVSAFGWMVHQAPMVQPPHLKLNWQSSDLAAAVTTEDWYDVADEGSVEREDEVKKHHAKAGPLAALSKLTRSIATLDITKVLPRLSVIPAHGLRSVDGTRFSTQPSVDSVFETSKDGTSEDVDALLVCASDGKVQVLMDDAVAIGSCTLHARPTLHSSHPDSVSHSILSQTDSGRMQLSTLDLPLATLGGPLLHTIATDTKRISNLLAYVMHTTRCIAHDYTTGTSFPTRLLANANEMLAEKQDNEGDIVLNLYHLALTGDFTPTMLEWLIDIVKETNHKRWDHAIIAMYTNIEHHLFINLLPALERLSVAVTTLRGQASFHDGMGNFDVPSALFANVLSGVDAMRLIARRLQLVTMSEIRSFRAFSRWVRVMIDIGVAGPGSKGAAETEDREMPSLDYPLLLSYIKATMSESAMRSFVQVREDMKGECASRAEWEAHPVIRQAGYNETRDMFRRTDHPDSTESFPINAKVGPAALANLPTTATLLAGNVRAALEHLAGWQSKMLAPPVSHALDFEETDMIVLDMQANVVDATRRASTKLLCLPSELRSQLMIYTFIAPSGEKGRQRSSGSYSTAPLPQIVVLQDETPDDGTGGDDEFESEVLDAKFLGETGVVMLERTSSDDFRIRVATISPGAGTSRFIRTYTLPHEGAFTPAKLVLGDRPGRRVCVVFGQGGREWRVNDLEDNVLSGTVSTSDPRASLNEEDTMDLE